MKIRDAKHAAEVMKAMSPANKRLLANALRQQHTHLRGLTNKEIIETIEHNLAK